MEYVDNENRYCVRDSHIINISREEIGPSSDSHADGPSSSNAPRIPEITSRGAQPPTVQSLPSVLSASNARLNISRREDNHGRQHQRSPLNSGVWISIELIIILGQIVAAIVVLSVSRNENPQTPLNAWVIGYTIGCFAALPHLYWRYAHRNNRGNAHETAYAQPNSSNGAIQASNVDENSNATGSNEQNTGNTNGRLNSLVDQFKMALDFFFAIWFVIGNVWVFGQHSSPSDAPNLYRLCIVFLIFSCIGYAMPLILCMTICCCFPCITSLLVSRDDLGQYRGARSELIDALPIYKFKSNRSGGRGCDTSTNEGGIVAVGTDKERVLQAEDAVCCICLGIYMDKDELRELSCSHLFHKKCVDEWLKINALCPLCKSSIREAHASSSFSNFNFHNM